VIKISNGAFWVTAISLGIIVGCMQCITHNLTHRPIAMTAAMICSILVFVIGGLWFRYIMFGPGKQRRK
jgi:hypothetical protein